MKADFVESRPETALASWGVMQRQAGETPALPGWGSSLLPPAHEKMAFVIRHSSFVIRHSSFVIRLLSFVI
jgi:hypothetical protein